MKYLIYLLRSITFNLKGRLLFPFLKPWSPTYDNLSAIDFLNKIKHPSNRYLPFMEGESEVNPFIPAGYTYLGQFIAHDITFAARTTSDLGSDPKSQNFRSPKLDLDSLYGRGPLGDPVFYNQNRFGGRTHFRIGKKIPVQIKKNVDSSIEHFVLMDLYRLNEGKPEIQLPLIPDVRNDDNILVSQLHLVFQLFHNKLVDELIKKYQIEKYIDQLENLSLFVDREALPEAFDVLDKRKSKHGASYKSTANLSEEKLSQIIAKKLQGFSQVKNEALEEIMHAWNNNKYYREFIITTKTSRSVEKTSFFEENQYDHNLRSFITLDSNKFDEFLNIILKSNTFKYYQNQASPYVAASKLAIITSPKERVFELVANLQAKFQGTYVEIQSLLDLLLDLIFQKAKESLLMTYHRIIFYDYLPRIIDKRVWKDIIVPLQSDGKHRLKRLFFKSKNADHLPLEFTTAFFRFGHSMVRDRYIFFQKTDNKENWESDNSKTIFGAKRPNAPTKVFVDWRLFFFNRNEHDPFSDSILSGKIEPLIAFPMLNDLGRTDHSSRNIVFRNLERSRRAGLPSGQSIAAWFWVLGLIKYSEIIHSGMLQQYDDISNLRNSFPSIEGYSFKNFCDHSPLWFYTLLEAYYLNEGNQLGPVASRIVGEVLIGLLEDAPNSILKEKEINFDLAKKEYTPEKPSDIYSMIQLLKYIDVYDGKKTEPEPDQDGN